MDDNGKQCSSYQLDQEVLDARGIDMSVEEVATLSTCRYAERVAALRLSPEDLGFLKSLRRRIKNRLASQNSRRRSVEHLRRLTRELRVVRAKRNDVLTERRELVARRDAVRAACTALRLHIVKVMESRSDHSAVPTIDLARITESQPKDQTKIVAVTETKTPLLAECFLDNKIERDKNIFECRIDKIVQNSVNHIYNKEKEIDKKKVFAKTVFISNEKLNSNVKTVIFENGSDIKQVNEVGDVRSIDSMAVDGVLNLSVKERRRTHGRKQSAPRRIPYAFSDKIENEDGVLDLKIKKEAQ